MRSIVGNRIHADGADARVLNPSGLSMPTSARPDRPLSATIHPKLCTLWPRLLERGALRSLLGGQRRRLLYLWELLVRLPHQFSNVRALRNSLTGIAAMLKRVLVASRGA